MKRKKIIALCLSLFVLPGTGHIYLKKKLLGYGLSILVIVIVLVVAVAFEWQAIEQVKKIGLVGGDPMAQVQAILGQTFESNMDSYLGWLYFVAFIWVAAALDILFIKIND